MIDKVIKKIAGNFKRYVFGKISVFVSRSKIPEIINFSNRIYNDFETFKVVIAGKIGNKNIGYDYNSFMEAAQLKEVLILNAELVELQNKIASTQKTLLEQAHGANMLAFVNERLSIGELKKLQSQLEDHIRNAPSKENMTPSQAAIQSAKEEVYITLKEYNALLHDLVKHLEGAAIVIAAIMAFTVFLISMSRISDRYAAHIDDIEDVTTFISPLLSQISNGMMTRDNLNQVDKQLDNLNNTLNRLFKKLNKEEGTLIEKVEALMEKVSIIQGRIDATEIKRHEDAGKVMKDIIYPAQEIVVDIDDMITVARWLSSVASSLNLFNYL